MSRYIDADKLESQLFRDGIAGIFLNYPRRIKFTIGEIRSMLKNERIAPTADVVEVRHGYWKEQDDGWDGVMYTCSVCHCDWVTIDGTPSENNMRYCPECGAKMDGERKEK